MAVLVAAAVVADADVIARRRRLDKGIESRQLCASSTLNSLLLGPLSQLLEYFAGQVSLRQPIKGQKGNRLVVSLEHDRLNLTGIVEFG